MLRAVAIAVLLIAAVLGGYLYWLRRARAHYEARSLSAAPVHHGYQLQTRTLHVEGCAKDFTVKVGELVEPQITPALARSSLAQSAAIYGPPTKRVRNGDLEWQQDAFTLTEDNPGKPASSLHLAIHAGHVVQTLDDVEVGIDSFNAIFIKMRDRNIPVTERLTHGKNSWTLTATIPSSCGPAWQSEYARTLPETPELDREIAPRITNGIIGQSRPDAFLNKLATSYTLRAAGKAGDASPNRHNK